MQYGKLVVQGQATFVSEDAKMNPAILVPTIDLSKFYHYDPLAQIIIGNVCASWNDCLCTKIKKNYQV